MTTVPTRSKTISVLALFFLAEAMVALAIAAFFLLIPETSSHITQLFERLGLSAALGNLLAVPPLLTAALAGLTFRGLWRLEAWARLAAIVFFFMVLLASIIVLAFLTSFQQLNRSNFWLSALVLLGSLLSFAVLLRSSFQLDEATSKDARAAAPSSPSPSLPQASIPQHTPQPSAPADGAPYWVPPPAPPAAASSTAMPDLAPTRTVPDAMPTQQLPTAGTQRLPAAEPVAWLIVRSGPEMGQKFSILAGHSLTLGRDPQRAGAVLTDPTVSSLHAQIRHENGQLVLYDLNSTNGTYVHDRMVQQHVLQDGDEFRIGTTVLFFTTTP